LVSFGVFGGLIFRCEKARLTHWGKLVFIRG
jgi:hypothetical protein